MIIINICLLICKKHVLPKKNPRKHQIPRDRMALMRKILKLQREIQWSTKHQTKENVLNQTKEIWSSQHHNKILEELEKSNNVDVIYLDFAIALDKVDHGILLNKKQIE